MVRMKCTATLDNPRWILSMLGLWMNAKVTFLERMKLLLGTCIHVIALTIICQIIAKAATAREFKLLNRMICVLVAVVPHVAKWLTLIIKQNDVRRIMLEIDSQVSKLLLGYFVTILGTYLIIGTFLPIFTNIKPILPPPFDVGVYDNAYNIGLLLVCSFVVLNSLGLEMLCLTLLSLCVAQLNILDGQLLQIGDGRVGTNKCKKKTHLETYTLIQQIVDLHEEINRLIKTLSNFLSFPLFAQFTCGCFMVYNTVLQFTILREPGLLNTFGMCCYSGFVFAQMWAYHFLGNEIMYKSNTIIESAYSSKWYQLDIKSKKAIILLMERAKRPLLLKSYKYIFINLDSLGVVIRWAYSVFALIKVRYG